MIVIYPDGACSGNPGPGAAAIVVVDGDGRKIEESSLFELKTTNNRMELTAVSMALRYCIQNHITECTIIQDSLYVVRGINSYMNTWANNGWKITSGSQVKNMDLWTEIYELWSLATSVANCSISHIDGHSGNEFNDDADKLARKTIKQNKNDKARQE